jgi:hypothetical protein
MAGRMQEGQQLGGKGMTGLLLIYLVLSALMWWLTMGRFAVDEKRMLHLEESCSPR